MAEIRIEHVSKFYDGGGEAVHNVTLYIEDKEFLVLVGPSGCGKSTTLRMVAGLEEVTHGQIRIGNRTVNDVAPKDRDIAMVFQNYALYPHMSVYKNMAFGLKLRRFSKQEIDERVRWAADILGLTNLLARKPKALSGGQRQRVALGRAIVRRPAAFLFDEPLSNLDAKLRVETRAELKRLHQRLCTTTIYVTHDQEEAMTLGDRVVVMKGGKVHQSDSPLAIYNSPVNRFVAGFLGMPPMNFIEGELVADNGLTWFEGQGVRLSLLPRQAQSVARYVGRKTVLGIRPDNMHLSRAIGDDAGHQIQVKVTVLEPLGRAVDAYVTTHEGANFVARIDADCQLKPGADVVLSVHMDKCHVFEPGELGENLTRRMAVESSTTARRTAGERPS